MEVTSTGFTALLLDRRGQEGTSVEEFPLTDVSDPDVSLCVVGARFQYLTAYRVWPDRKYRAAWFEFEGSDLNYR